MISLSFVAISLKIYASYHPAAPVLLYITNETDKNFVLSGILLPESPHAIFLFNLNCKGQHVIKHKRVGNIVVGSPTDNR